MRKFEIVQEYKDKDINIPVRATKYSAGYDIEAARTMTLPPLSIKLTKEQKKFLKEKGKVNYYDELEGIALNECFDFNKIFGQKAVMIPTGLKIYCNNDEYISFVMRSSVASKGKIIMPNAPATIDADYVDNSDNEGHCYIPLINLNPFPITIEKGEKIAQAIFHKYLTTDDEENIEKVREGGIGSTNNTIENQIDFLKKVNKESKL